MPTPTDAETAVRRHPHFIDGERQGGPWLERRSPHDGDRIVALVASGDETDVDAAMRAARRALPGWSGLSGFERARMLSTAAELLSARAEAAAHLIHEEEGKTLEEGAAEVRRAVDYLDFFAAEVRRDDGRVLASEDPRQTVMTWRVPIGVVGVIAPWNFPLTIPAWKIAPALASGNTVVIKPASEAAGPAGMLVEALSDAGVPPGVINVVNGRGAVVGAAIADHPELDALSFTGSNGVGRSLSDRIAGRRVRVQLELGGVNACVVLDDADPLDAARLIARGAFGVSGQACTATRQVLCSAEMATALGRELAALADDLGARGAIGPLVSGAARREVDAAVRSAVDSGATTLTTTPAPVVLSGVTADMAIARDEVFGPVVSVIEVAGLDEAVARINAGEYGLTAGIITDSLGAAMEFARAVQVGTVKINRATTGNQPNVPFGGVKASSNGMYREQGAEALSFFTRTKSVYLGW